MSAPSRRNSQLLSSNSKLSKRIIAFSEAFTRIWRLYAPLTQNSSKTHPPSIGSDALGDSGHDHSHMAIRSAATPKLIQNSSAIHWFRGARRLRYGAGSGSDRAPRGEGDSMARGSLSLPAPYRCSLSTKMKEEE